MPRYRVKATVANDGTLTLKDMPFEPGAQVDVIVHSRTPQREGDERYPLRGAPIGYLDPFTSVAEDDWDALQ